MPISGIFCFDAAKIRIVEEIRNKLREIIAMLLSFLTFEGRGCQRGERLFVKWVNRTWTNNQIVIKFFVSAGARPQSKVLSYRQPHSLS